MDQPISALAISCTDISEDLVRWVCSEPSDVPRNGSSGLARGESSGNVDLLILCAPVPTDFCFARALCSRLQSEAKELAVAIGGSNLEARSTTCAACEVKEFGTVNAEDTPQAPCAPQLRNASAAMFLLTPEALKCGPLLLELAWCLEWRRRIALVYDVRSCGCQTIVDFLHEAAPSPLIRYLSDVMSVREATAITILDYIAEYEEFCIHALLTWLHPNSPRQSSCAALVRHRENLDNGASTLCRPPSPEDPGPEPVKIIARRSVKAKSFRLSKVSRNSSLGRRGTSASPKASDGESHARDTAVGLLFSGSRGDAIATKVKCTCQRLLPAVRVSRVCADIAAFDGDAEARSPEQVANLLFILTPGCLQDDLVLQTLERAVRAVPPVRLILLQDILFARSVLDEVASLAEPLRAAMLPGVALPWLDCLGFLPCLMCMLGARLFQSLAAPTDDAAGMSLLDTGGRGFDVMFTPCYAAESSWSYPLRLALTRVCGTNLRSLMDDSCAQDQSSCSRFFSRVLVIVATPGFLTRLPCQRSIIAANRAGISIVFVQHLQAYIDLEQEVASLQSNTSVPSDVSTSCTELLEEFKDVMFRKVWTSNLKSRPPVFAFANHLEQSCAEEVLNNLRPGRLRRPGAPERFEHGAQVLHGLLKNGLDNEEDAYAGLCLVANQMVSGIGEQLCSAMIRADVFSTLAKILQNYVFGTQHRNSRSIERDMTAMALKVMRSLAVGGGSGNRALERLVDSTALVAALFGCLKDAASDQSLQSDVLEIVKHLCTSSAEHVTANACLETSFKELFHTLRADLHPLELVHEALVPGHAAIDVANLKTALNAWQRTGHSSTTVDDPAKVREATQLLECFNDLQEVVIMKDGERARGFLDENLGELERLKGAHDLIHEARKIALQFEEQKQALEEQLRSRLDMVQQLAQSLGDPWFLARGNDLADRVGDASRSLFETLSLHGCNLCVCKDVFFALERLASSRKEAACAVAERAKSVDNVFALLTPSIGKRRASPAAGGASNAVHARSLEAACIAGCGLLRTLLAARRKIGISYERCFHRGVAARADVLVSLLRLFPMSRDVQLVAIHLFLEVAMSDFDGAQSIADALVPNTIEQEASTHLLLLALQHYHIQAEDCTAILSLINNLVLQCHVLPGTPGNTLIALIREVVRCAKNHREFVELQCQSLGIIKSLICSEMIDTTSILVDGNVLETVLLSAARHGGSENCNVLARDVVTQIAKRCSADVFCRVFETVVRQQRPNGSVVQEACAAYACACKEMAECKQGFSHVKAACGTGLISSLIRSISEHREDMNVLVELPHVMDGIFKLGKGPCLGAKIRDIALDASIIELFDRSLIMQSRHMGKEAEKLEESFVDTRDWKASSVPVHIPPLFEVLGQLVCPERWADVASHFIVSSATQVLFRMAHHDTLKHGMIFWATLLRHVEGHVSMAQVHCLVRRETPRTLLAVAADEIRRAESRAFRHWRAGNFLLAATEFRNAHARCNEAISLCREACPQLLSILENHLDQMPFARYEQLCLLHHGTIYAHTVSARTGLEIEPGHGSLVETEDCMICLEPFDTSSVNLWQCRVCNKQFHSGCVATWRRQHDNCPHCRSDASRSAVDWDAREVPAYNRARAVAVAAEDCLRDAEEGREFLTSAVASLWRTANRMGYQLQVPGTFLARDQNRAAVLDELAAVGSSPSEMSAVKFAAAFVRPCVEMARRENSGETDMLTVRKVLDSLASVSWMNSTRASPFYASLQETWGRTALPRAGLAALCSLSAAACVMSRRMTSAEGADSETHNYDMSRLTQLISSFVTERLPFRVAQFLEAKEDLPLLAALFLWRFGQFNPEAHDSAFSCLDMVVQVLAKTHENKQLRSCLCTIVHDAIFVEEHTQISEDRMLTRVQREGSPRETATLEEWFLDTLLAKHGANDAREDILLNIGADVLDRIAVSLVVAET